MEMGGKHTFNKQEASGTEGMGALVKELDE